MEIELKAKGTAAKVKAEIAKQIKGAGAQHQGSGWPALVGVRDHIGAEVDRLAVGAGPDATFEISGKIAIVVSAAPAAPAAEAAETSKKK